MKKLISEFIGTFLLVLVGCGSMTLDEVTAGGVGLTLISLAFGGIVFLVIFFSASISGAHINPAVSFAFFVSGTMKRMELIQYWVAQIAGAIAAGWSLKLLFPESVELGVTIPEGTTVESAFVELGISIGLTFLILYVALIARLRITWIAILVGLYVGLICYFFGPLSRAGMNPARSIGPAVVAGIYVNFWIYLFMPMLGGAISSAAYLFFKKHRV